MCLITKTANMHTYTSCRIAKCIYVGSSVSVLVDYSERTVQTSPVQLGDSIFLTIYNRPGYH